VGVVEIIGAAYAPPGETDESRIKRIRAAALHATRNPACTEEFLRRAPGDIEWLCDELAAKLGGCDECILLRVQLSDARRMSDERSHQLRVVHGDRDRLRTELQEREEQITKLRDEVRQREEQIAELKDEASQLRFREESRA
jgi:predicted nuclease with TOPRIM domain